MIRLYLGSRKMSVLSADSYPTDSLNKANRSVFAEEVHFIVIQLEDVPCGVTVLLAFHRSFREIVRQQWKHLLLNELT